MERPTPDPPPLTRSAPTGRVTNGIDRAMLWLVVSVVVVPTVLVALYLIINIVGAAIGADDY